MRWRRSYPGRYQLTIGKYAWVLERRPGTKATEPRWYLWREGRLMGVMHSLGKAKHTAETYPR